jgi:dipeptidyl aminopeptidase/acylaminoacyl peptidase
MGRPFILFLFLVTTLVASPWQDEPDEPLSIPHILSIATYQDFSLSPDGKRVVVTASLLGTQNVYVISDPDERAEPLAKARGRDREPDWSEDGRHIVFSSDREEGWHLFVAAPDATEARQLTQHPGDDRTPRWSPDGKNVAFLSRLPGSETGWDVWTIPYEGGEARQLTRDPMDEQDPQWSPDGKWIAYTFRGGRHVNRRIGIVPAMPTDTAGPRELLPDGWEGDSFSPRWSPGGKQIAFVSDHDGMKTIYFISAQGGEPEPFIQSGYEETEPAWSPDGTEIAHISNREGNLRLTLTPVATRKSRPLTLGSGVHARPVWRRDGKTVVCFYEGPIYPNNIWAFHTQGGRGRMTENLPTDLDVRQLIHPELVRYTSFDDRTITGYLYLPPEAGADKPAPLIVHPHGGPTSQWKNGWHPFVQFLAQQGYAVFAPNVRGSSGFGLEFENLNDKEWGKGDLEDLIIGARELMGRPEIRSDRVGIWGVSYGGFLTLAAIGKYPDFFTCAVEAVGMPDLERLYRETNTEGRTYLERELGPLRGNLTLYRELSPVRNVDRIRIPLLSFHGEDYPLVPLSTKVPFLRALQKPGSHLTELIFKGDTARATYRFDVYPGSSRGYMEKILEYIRIYL